MDNRTARLALGLLMAGSFLVGTAYALIIPPWQMSDEPTHFAYVQWLVERRAIPVTERTIPRVDGHADPQPRSAEFAQSLEYAELNRVRSQPNLHQTFRGDPAEIRENLRGASREIPAGPSTLSSAIYSPLTYAVAALPYIAFRSTDIFTRLIAMRLFLGLLLPLTVLIIYRLALLLRSDRRWALGVAGTAAFLPMLAPAFFSISNDGLLIFLFTLSVFLLARSEQRGWTLRRAVLVGLILGLGFLAKPQLLALLPLVAGLLAVRFLRRPAERTAILKQTGVMAGVWLAITGWWLVWTWRHFGSLIGSVAIEENLPEFIRPQTLLNGIAYTFIYRPWEIFKSFWGNFGWRDAPIPEPLTIFLFLIMAVAGVGLLRTLLRRPALGQPDRLPFLTPLLASVAIFDLMMTGIFVQHFLETGSIRFPVHGRYYLPLIAPLAILSVAGLMHWFTQRRQPWLFLGLVAAMIVLNLYALTHVVIPRYYV